MISRTEFLRTTTHTRDFMSEKEFQRMNFKSHLLSIRMQKYKYSFHFLLCPSPSKVHAQLLFSTIVSQTGNTFTYIHQSL